MTNNELNLQEMETISGGYKRPAEKAGFIIYQIRKGDTLYGIAQKHDCTVKELMDWNPKFTNPRMIYAGDYLYIRA